jgi:predicted dehydrogenase
LGSIADKHIKALRAIDKKIVIRALRSAKGSAEFPGISNIYSIAEIGNPTFVIISNPTHLHLDTIKTFTELGIPMLIEKPAFHQLEGTTEILALIESQKISTYVACNLRFHPCIQFIKDYLDKSSARINEVNIYCGSYLPDWRPGKDYKTIYSANKDMGGGVHLDLFHEMDYACWLFGYPKSYHGFSSQLSTIGIDAPDYANYLLNYQHFNMSVVLNYYRRQPKRTIEILFEEDTLTIDLIGNKISNGDGQVIFETPEFTILTTYIDQLRYFMTCLSNNQTPMNTLHESVAVLKISLSNESIKG